MDSRATRGAGWIAFSSAVLIIGGAFAIIDGLMAVYRARFFSSSAVYVFSDLKTWGWIVFGLGVARTNRGRRARRASTRRAPRTDACRS